MSEPRTEGWGNLLNASHAHYFTDGRSLCGRWLTFGVPIWESNQALGAEPCRGTCKACWKRRARFERKGGDQHVHRDST